MVAQSLFVVKMSDLWSRRECRRVVRSTAYDIPEAVFEVSLMYCAHSCMLFTAYSLPTGRALEEKQCERIRLLD